MFSIMVIGVIAIAWAVFNWYVEIKPWLDNMYKPKYSPFTVIAVIQRLYAFFINALRMFTDGKYFILDILVTILAVDMLGFGAGFAGGVMGLFFSNAVSELIKMIMRRTHKRQLLESGVAA